MNSSRPPDIRDHGGPVNEICSGVDRTGSVKKLRVTILRKAKTIVRAPGDKFCHRKRLKYCGTGYW